MVHPGSLGRTLTNRGPLDNFDQRWVESEGWGQRNQMINADLIRASLGLLGQ